MDFSALRQRIVFLKPLDTKLNAMRENVPVWIPFKPNLRNNLIIDDKSEEEAQKLREETTYQVKTRYFPRITTDMKILYDSQILDIVSVLNVGGRKIELQIVAKERDRNGKEC